MFFISATILARYVSGVVAAAFALATSVMSISFSSCVSGVSCKCFNSIILKCCIKRFGRRRRKCRGVGNAKVSLVWDCQWYGTSLVRVLDRYLVHKTRERRFVLLRRGAYLSSIHRKSEDRGVPDPGDFDDISTAYRSKMRPAQADPYPQTPKRCFS